MKKELILKGTINILILVELTKNKLYGYAIERKINDRLSSKLPTGTIYTLLHSLENKGYIKHKSEKNENGRDAKTYTITDTGMKFLKNHKDPLLNVRTILDYLIDEINKL